MRSRRLLLITIGLALVLIALIGWAVQALRLPERALSALTTQRESDRNPPLPLEGD